MYVLHIKIKWVLVGANLPYNRKLGQQTRQIAKSLQYKTRNLLFQGVYKVGQRRASIITYKITHYSFVARFTAWASRTTSTKCSKTRKRSTRIWCRRIRPGETSTRASPPFTRFCSWETSLTRCLFQGLKSFQKWLRQLLHSVVKMWRSEQWSGLRKISILLKAVRFIFKFGESARTKEDCIQERQRRKRARN